MVTHAPENSLSSQTLPKARCNDEPIAAIQARDDHTTFNTNLGEDGIAESPATESAYTPASECDMASTHEEISQSVQQEASAGEIVGRRARKDVATQVSQEGGLWSPLARRAHLIIGLAILVLGILYAYAKHEDTRLENERQFKILEREQMQTELTIKKLDHEEKMMKLKNEQLEMTYKHEEKMLRLEGERKKNDTLLEVYATMLTPRKVTHRKVDSGIFTTTTESSEVFEVPYSNLPNDVKRIVDENSGNKAKTTDEDDRESI